MSDETYSQRATKPGPEMCRAQLRLATAGLCSHGTSYDRCAQTHDGDAPESEHESEREETNA